MNKAQETQDEIFRKMSASKKLQMVDDFYRFSKKLQKLQKTNDITKVHQSNKLSSRSA